MGLTYVRAGDLRRAFGIPQLDRALIGTTPHAKPTDVDRAVLAARRAFDEGPWPWMKPRERAASRTRTVPTTLTIASRTGSATLRRTSIWAA